MITQIGTAKILSENDLREAFRKVGPGVTRYTIQRDAQVLTLDINCATCTVSPR